MRRRRIRERGFTGAGVEEARKRGVMGDGLAKLCGKMERSRGGFAGTQGLCLKVTRAGRPEGLAHA